MPRDTYRQKAYDAEYFVQRQLDRAERGDYRVDFFGSTLVLGQERKFADVGSIQRYVDLVTNGSGKKIEVRNRKGVTKAHHQAGVIAIPVEHRSRWACREIVILHEVAHALAPAGSMHNADWASTFCDLVDTWMGPEVALLLRSQFQESGLRT